VRLELHVEIGVEIGRVSMSVIPVPFPGSLRPEPAGRLGAGVKFAPKQAVSVFTSASWGVNWIGVNVT
jgi:hypothetical protein